MQITSGKISRAIKVVIYGTEGIGKSTFASKFPNPLFIDTEGSTGYMDVRRLPKPTSYQMLLEEIRFVKNDPSVCQTLVIDTLDWAEQLIVESVLAAHQKKGIEDFGYGNGYVYVKEEFGRFLNYLSDIIDVGINVVLTAHSHIKKFEQPDEMGAYDRYELKIGKKTGSQTAPLAKEWCDMLLFVNYKTYSIATDKDGKKHKVQGGQRIMYTTHHACWDAKNRHGLADELPFDFSSIAHLFNQNIQKAPQPRVEPLPQTNVNVTEPISDSQAINDFLTQNTGIVDGKDIAKMNEQNSIPQNLPKALKDLMIVNDVTEQEIRQVVAEKGYYTFLTPVENYDINFIDGCLIGAWDSVFAMIKEKRKLPF